MFLSFFTCIIVLYVFAAVLATAQEIDFTMNQDIDTKVSSTQISKNTEIESLTHDVSQLVSSSNFELEAVSYSNLHLVGKSNGVNGGNDNVNALTGSLFTDAAAMAVNSAGEVFFWCASCERIQRIVPGGNMYRYAGRLTGEPYLGYNNVLATGTSFDEITQMAFDSCDNLYIADPSTNTIRVIGSGLSSSYQAGYIYVFAGIYNQEGSTAPIVDQNPLTTSLKDTYNVAVDSSDNVYFVTDFGTNTAIIWKVIGGYGGVLRRIGSFSRCDIGTPRAIALDTLSNYLYIPDLRSSFCTNVYKVRTTTFAQNLITVSNLGSINRIYGIAVNRDNTIFVIDEDHAVFSFSQSIPQSVVFAGDRSGTFNDGTVTTIGQGLVLDKSGNLYFSTFSSAIPAYNIFKLDDSFATTVTATCLNPTSSPSVYPTTTITLAPSSNPSSNPSSYPTAVVTLSPSSLPSICPTAMNTVSPSSYPSTLPTFQPTPIPSAQPSTLPTLQPTHIPSAQPSTLPTLQPTHIPTSKPSSKPTPLPTTLPSFKSTNNPTNNPTNPSVPITPTNECYSCAKHKPTYYPTPKPSAPTMKPSYCACECSSVPAPTHYPTPTN